MEFLSENLLAISLIVSITAVISCGIATDRDISDMESYIASALETVLSQFGVDSTEVNITNGEMYDEDTRIDSVAEDIDETGEDDEIDLQNLVDISNDTLDLGAYIGTSNVKISSAEPAKPQFTMYQPVSVNSRYYRDAGRIPLTMDAEFETVDETYFEDSCWIGDSRCLGVYDYSPFSQMADFYCDNGYCAYDYTLGKTLKNQRTGAKVTVEEAMKAKQYGKVYIMMGINDCGYGTTGTFREQYQAMVDMIAEAQPEAIIYLVGNMHISHGAEEKGNPEVWTNLNINAKNVAISGCADGIRSFYLDFNSLFTDEDGYLIDELTFDGYHLYAAGYLQMIDFFMQHAIVK